MNIKAKFCKVEKYNFKKTSIKMIPYFLNQIIDIE